MKAAVRTGGRIVTRSRPGCRAALKVRALGSRRFCCPLFEVAVVKCYLQLLSTGAQHNDGNDDLPQLVAGCLLCRATREAGSCEGRGGGLAATAAAAWRGSTGSTAVARCAMCIAPQLRPHPTNLSRAAAAAPPAAAAPRCGGAGGAAPTACPPRKSRSARCTPPLRGCQGAEGVRRGMCGRVEREQQPARQPGKGGHAQLPSSPGHRNATVTHRR